MAENTAIEWADHTFNPWIGCTKVSPGCDHCYAEARMDTRLHVVGWGAGQPRKRTSGANWALPTRWNAKPFYECVDCGWRGDDPHLPELAGGATLPMCRCGGDLRAARRRVFCASLADVFDNEVPDEWRADLFDLIDATPNLDWLVLTKRIGNVVPMLKAIRRLRHGVDSQGIALHPRPNVWLGATIVNQEEADRDIPKLLATPAAVRFLSMEPLLGHVDLTDLVIKESVGEQHYSALECDVDPEDDEWRGATIDWVIVGGESGPGARPMHPDWARSLRDQCAAASVPFLFKQWGEFLPASADVDDPAIADVPDSRLFWSDGEKWDRFDGQRAGVDLVARIGKKAAGRLLDGVEHNGFPEVAHAPA